MEVFAIIGFIFGLSAFGTAMTNKSRLKALEEELEQVKQSMR